MSAATATDLTQWSSVLLGGLQSPGTIPRGGVKGFKRETGWDIKSGKGAKGATLTLKDQPPCKGSFTIQLIGPGGFYADGTASTDFALWDNFVAEVLTSETSTQQQASGISIYYPGLASIGLSVVVVAHYTGPEHAGKGLYNCTIDLIEWSPPPKASIVATVAGEGPDAVTPGTPRTFGPATTRALANQQAVQQAAAAAAQGPATQGPF